MTSDSVSAQVRRLSSLSIASCTLLARLVAQLLARCLVVAPPMNVHVTNRLGCDAMCLLSAMQPRHGHSKCSHLGGAERIMATERGQRATGESEFRESMVLESCGSKWESGRTCRRAESSYRSTQNNST